jgi:hypothetical protein
LFEALSSKLFCRLRRSESVTGRIPASRCRARVEQRRDLALEIALGLGHLRFELMNRGHADLVIRAAKVVKRRLESSRELFVEVTRVVQVTRLLSQQDSSVA